MYNQGFLRKGKKALGLVLAFIMALSMAPGGFGFGTAMRVAAAWEETSHYKLEYDKSSGSNRLTMTIKGAVQDEYVFRTPGTAQGWLPTEAGWITIEGLPPNSAWFISQKGRYIYVDASGAISLNEFYNSADNGWFTDMWPDCKYVLTRVADDDGNFIYDYKVDGTGIGVGLPLVAAGAHPRVFFSQADVDAINAKRTVGNNANGTRGFTGVISDIETNAARNVDSAASSSAANTNLCDTIEANAFLYAMGDGDAFGAKAVSLAATYATNYATGSLNASGGDPQRTYNRVARALAQAYDWAYNHADMDEEYASTGKTNREVIREGIIYILSYHGNETGWLEPMLGPVVGHGGEEGLLFTYLMSGIAIYDEFPDLLDYAYNMIMKEYVPVREEFNRSGSNGQGTGYTASRHENDMYSAFLMLGAGGENPYSPSQVNIIQNLAVYQRRPDGQILSTGDDFVGYSKSFGSYWNNEYTMVWLAASLWGDEVLQEEANRSYVNTNLIHQMIMRDHTITPADYNDLPKTVYYDGVLPSMTARTGWNNAAMNSTRANDNIAVAHMKFDQYYPSNHAHLDVGSFQLYYKGWLAIDSGSYASGNWDGWGYANNTKAGHDYNYLKRGVAHNTMTVLDPDEVYYAWTSPWQSNDGGIRSAGNMKEAATLNEWLDIENGYKVSDVIGHDFGGGSDPAITPLYSYIAGDLTDAYTDKVTDYKRSMVFLNLDPDNAGQDMTAAKDVPAVFMVYDAIESSDANFEKNWLLHTVEEPVVSGLRTTLTKNTRTANGITVNYGGKMVNDTLLPLDAAVEKIGGAGKAFWVANSTAAAVAATGQHNIIADGADANGGYNYAGTKAALQSHPYGMTSGEAGEWRIEVSPGAAREADQFLNVIQMMDASGTPLTTSLLESAEGGMVGANADNWDVYFSKTGERVDSEITITTSASTEYVLLTGVKEGNWVVNENGVLLPAITVTADAGTIYLEVSADTEYIIMPERLVPQAAAVTANPPSGVLAAAGQNVALSTATAGATIYFTLDGSAPTAADMQYATPIWIGEDTVIKAIAVMSGMKDSDEAAFAYTIHVPQPNGATPPPPIYTSGPSTGPTPTQVPAPSPTPNPSSIPAPSEEAAQFFVVEGETDENGIMEGTIPADAGEQDLPVVVIDGDVSITLDADRVKALLDIAGDDGKVTVSVGPTDEDALTEAQQAAADSNPVYQFEILVNGEAYTEGGALVSIPYTPEEGIAPESIVLYFIDEDGTAKVATNAYYDEAEGAFFFLMENGSAPLGAIGINMVVFADMAGHWAEAAVTFGAARGFFHGTGGGLFSPNVPVNGAMLAMIFANVAGYDTSGIGEGSLAGVPADAWYAKAAEWAAANNLLTGANGKAIDLAEPLTRENLAIMLDAFIEFMGYTPLVRVPDAVPFSDNAAMSRQGQTATLNLRRYGIVAGTPTGAYMPSETATRAEIAIVMHNLMTKVMNAAK